MMKPGRLAKLTLPDELQGALELGPPEQTLRALKPPTLSKIASNLKGERLRLVEGQVEVPDRVEVTCPDCGAEEQLNEGETEDRLLLIVGGYYDYAMRQLLLSIDADGLPALFSTDLQRVIFRFKELERMIDLFRRASESGDPAELRRGPALALSIAYHQSVFASVFMSVWRPPMPRESLSALEASSHSILVDLQSQVTTTPTRDLRLLGSRMLETVTRHLAQLYEQRAGPSTIGREFGPFSAIRHHELSLLARRDDSMVKQYGAKNVEEVFENQLSLVVQSLGFFVVPARRGERLVDLLCIAGVAEEKYSFILEAKSTRGNYAFPTKDQRALEST